jgi:hypothetical protein
MARFRVSAILLVIALVGVTGTVTVKAVGDTWRASLGTPRLFFDVGQRCPGSRPRTHDVVRH